jgi:hypothetical protein
VSPYTFIMSIITCISTLVSELMYNIQRRGWLISSFLWYNYFRIEGCLCYL